VYSAAQCEVVSGEVKGVKCARKGWWDINTKALEEEGCQEEVHPPAGLGKVPEAVLVELRSKK
jgi:hypothetical protein